MSEANLSNGPRKRRKTQKARLWAALLRFLIAISRLARGKGQLCHVLELYIRTEISGLEEIGVRRGIDNNFPQVRTAFASGTKITHWILLLIPPFEPREGWGSLILGDSKGGPTRPSLPKGGLEWTTRPVNL